MWSLGSWMSRKWQQCQARKVEAEQLLKKCGVSEDVLREQWEMQVKAQTQLAPSQYACYVLKCCF